MHVLRFWASLFLQYVFFQAAIKKKLKIYIKMFILLHFVYFNFSQIYQEVIAF